MLPIMEVKQPFTDAEWQATPGPVKQYIRTLEETIVKLLSKIDQLEKRIEILENKSNKNSQNSSKPPSSDSPYKRPEKKTKKVIKATDNNCWNLLRETASYQNHAIVDVQQ